MPHRGLDPIQHKLRSEQGVGGSRTRCVIIVIMVLVPMLQLTYFTFNPASPLAQDSGAELRRARFWLQKQGLDNRMLRSAHHLVHLVLLSQLLFKQRAKANLPY